MPKRKRSRSYGSRKRRKRTTRRRRRRKPSTIKPKRWVQPHKRRLPITISKNVGVPNRIFTKLRYSSSVTPSITGALAHYDLRINSCYDLDLTGTGHQPRGFDQMAGLWNKYLVRGAYFKFDLTFDVASGYDGKTYVGAIAAYTEQDDAPTLADYTDITELDTMFSPKPMVGSENARNRLSWSGYISVKKMFNITGKDLNDNNNGYGAQVGANPTQELMLGVVFASTSGVALSTEIVNPLLQITVVQMVEFRDPQDLGQS